MKESFIRQLARNVQYDMKIAMERSFMRSMTQTMTAPDPEPFSLAKMRSALAAMPKALPQIRESELALAYPKAKPHSDDMRDMVEHFHAMGLIERKPCALQIGNTMYVHPTIMRKLKAAGVNVVQN